MLIFIPSLGRHDRIIAGQSVLSELPKAAHDRCRLVVPVEQGAIYEQALHRKGYRVSVMRCDAKGIAATRRWIAEHSVDEKILMLDDDIKFQEHFTAESNKLNTHPTDESKMAMLDKVSSLLDEFAHVGIADRVAASRVPCDGSGGDKILGTGRDTVVLNTRLLRALGYRRTEHMACEHGRVDVMEDFDIALQLLRKGFQSANVAWWCQDQRATQWRGGCSTYRTHELHEQSARKLQELHPEFVMLRQKENKTGGEFGTRTEVTIQWGKAAASGS